jgi:RimJ/RimL family protein N-acetyltransferase
MTHTDLEPLLPALGKASANGIIIKTMAELKSEPDHARKTYDLTTKTREDIPYPDPISPLTFELFNRVYLQNPATNEAGSFIALHGDQYVGMTVILRLSEERLYVGYTAILREYRRKGIATALKILSIQHGRDQGYKLLGTTNDTLNVAILKLNDAIGFVRQPAQIMLVCQMKAE